MGRRICSRLLLLLVVLVSALALRPAHADGRAPPEPEAIDAAIERGVDWLLEEQRADGAWGTGKLAVGHTALAVFALLHAGLSEDAPGRPGQRLTRALRWIDAHGPGVTRAGDIGAGTYETALLLLVERARRRSAEPRSKRLVAILERSQAKNGQWGYDLPAGRRRHDAGDNSNAQFAVLALGAAVGEGLDVDVEVLHRAQAWWHAAVQSDGGFGYSSGGSRASASTGSMTAAGIAALTILDAALDGSPPASPETGAATRKLIADAVERLARDFEVDRNFGPAQGGARQRQRNAGRGWVHYFLWSVERAMVLADQEKIGTRDWYAEGAAHLLATQKKDGSWRAERPLYATAFALLFLTRAADPPRVFTPGAATHGPVTPGPGAGPPTPAEPAPAVPAPPTASLEELVRGDGTPDAIAAAALAAGPESLLDLVRMLDDPAPKVRQRANEALHTLLGAERVGRADRHPLARGRLKLWIRQHRSRLVAREGVFVLP